MQTVAEEVYKVTVTNHSAIPVWSRNFLLRRGLFASCGGWGEGRKEARGERWEGKRLSLFPSFIARLLFFF